MKTFPRIQPSFPWIARFLPARVLNALSRLVCMGVIRWQIAEECSRWTGDISKGC